MEPVAEKPLEAGVLLFLVGAVATGMVVMVATESDLVFSSANLREIPVIAAPSGPDRRAPSEPGGLAVPHQELEVFELFTSTPPTERWGDAREGTAESTPDPDRTPAAAATIPEEPLTAPEPAVRPEDT